MADNKIFHSKDTPLRDQDDKETYGKSLTQSPPPWKLGDVLDDFRLLKLLGRGGSSYVYRARDLTSDRLCALKLLQQASPADLIRNKLGFRKMILLDHPNLMRVGRIHQLGPYVAFSMEEIEGMTFADVVLDMQSGSRDWAYDQLLFLLRQYASGLAMMHSHGLIHRDIKPVNLMADRRGTAKIIDYGLVDSYSFDGVSFCTSNTALGTPYYSAPEATFSQTYLPSGDIFSLGISMLDALRVLRAFGDESIEKLSAAAIRNEDDSTISEVVDKLPDEVPRTIRRACRQMLATNPADRPTAIELSRLGLSSSHPVLWPPARRVIGRDREINEIQTWADGVFAGEVSRLRITGPPGIGKTALVEEAVSYIESKRWGQVFSARCRARENQPQQAFDQICDAIAIRYMQSDREPLELDPVSAHFLQNAFPVLRNIIECTVQLAPPGMRTDGSDALEAAARMSDQLRRVGPLFLVVDDAHWADRSSLNVLDRLQSATGAEGLGIITVSSEEVDQQRHSTPHHIMLGPLSLDDCYEFLGTEAERWSVEMSSADLWKLSSVTEGTPFRLREVADEFKPGGALSTKAGDTGSAVDDYRPIDRLWKRRVQRLTRDARRVLPFVATARRRASIDQLGQLSGLGDSVETAISELARERLIIDDANGGECISMFHDHVADELIKALSDDDKRKANHKWALLLVQQDRAKQLSARIASHFFAAQQPGRAVEHAVLAGEDCERQVAFMEAASWYYRAAEHVDGVEKVTQLRNAVRCYSNAEAPAEAAECLLELATLVDGEDRRQSRSAAITLLIRSGRFAMVRDQLRQYARELNLPRPKSRWLAILTLIGHKIRSSLRVGRRWPASADAAIAQGELDSNEKLPSTPDGDATRRSLDFCLALTRPMLMLDTLYASELSVVVSDRANRYGDPLQRNLASVEEAVFKCADRGWGRRGGERRLRAIERRLEGLNLPRAKADVLTGVACSHMLVGRWAEVEAPAEQAIDTYEKLHDTNDYLDVHVQRINLWAKWNLGQWTELRHTSESLLSTAAFRGDLMRQMIVTTGFGASALLIADEVSRLDKIRSRLQRARSPVRSMQLVDMFDSLSLLLQLLYSGDFDRCWTEYEKMLPHLKRIPFVRLQILRLSAHQLGGLGALHQLSSTRQIEWQRRAEKAIQRLRGERTDFAKAMADLQQGLLEKLACDQQDPEQRRQSACRLLELARNAARSQRLLPIQFAAEDALSGLRHETAGDQLVELMKAHGVERPAQLERTWTVADVV